MDAKKPVILCGDLNVAHKEIDLANPKTNKKSAGFTVEERSGECLLKIPETLQIKKRKNYFFMNDLKEGSSWV